MWIRSQDRMKLVKTNDTIEIELLTINKYTIECPNTVLGTYKTKERAIKVLDEISIAIEKWTDDTLNYEVYEMPKE